ncbi:peptidase M14 [Pendulispora brunnea]|uniref:Peptidase M14 n=1 Tax=Pendulispora brunnea TaxID=2905690 RepID=A0ABZ2JYU7_9BACT
MALSFPSRRNIHGITPITALLALACSASSGTSLTDPSLVTVAEESGFTRTGRYDEVVRLCNEYPRRYLERVRCYKFGDTPEGRPMLAFVAGAKSTLEPATSRDRPVVLVQGGIHAGEIDGKDAGFLVLRDMLDGAGDMGKILDAVTVVFVPVFNVDGHERFGPNNRPNQIGPEEAGFRATAHNLNLNRDYMKAEAPEMVAMLRLMQNWDPILYIDTHVTDGAKFEHDVSIDVAPRLGGTEELREHGKNLSNALLQGLSSGGHLPVDFYPTLLETDNPASGFGVQLYPPRYSHGYRPLDNRLAILVETHSWKDYPTRVKLTKDVLVGLLRETAAKGRTWMDAAHSADQRTADRLPGTEVPLAYTTTDHTVTYPFRGYAYQRVQSEISGLLWTKYDTSRPEIWNVPLHDEIRPTVTTKVPAAGYVVPAAYAQRVAEKLDAHGIAYTRLDGGRRAVPMEVFRADEATTSARSSEARQTASAKGKWVPESRDIPALSLFVPTKQAKAMVAVHLLDPQGPDSLFAWGFFNGHLEQKEYIENYVIEDIARQMLAKDPQLKAEFESKLASDAVFAKDSAARLEFFYRRTPYWDERYRLYPIYRVEKEP